MVNSKRKGQNFENTVYNALLRLGYSVKKPLGSGGQVEPGDIIVFVGGRVFCLECKRYHSLSRNKVLGFWDNHRNVVKVYNQEWIPVLIYRLDRKRHINVCLGSPRGSGFRALFWGEFLEYLGGIK